MSRATLILGGCTTSFFLLIGCGSQPIGRVAVPGTTITIPVPPTYYPGYGLRIGTDPATAPAYDENNPSEDPQRGELLFKLVKLADPPEVYGYLPRRWITRVAIDESSPQAHNGAVVDTTAGQVLAFVDIPVDVEDGDYVIEVERYRRDPSSPTNAFAFVTTDVDINIPFGGGIQTVPWIGWGTSDPSAGIPIKIQGPAIDPPEFTDLVGWDEVFGVYSGSLPLTAADLRNYTPVPTFTIVAYAGTAPAAWEAEFDYPKDRIRIRSVKLFRDAPSNGIVRYEADDPNATVSCGAGSGRLKVKVIDPDQETLGVKVAYELRNFADTCGARAVPSADFDLVANTFRAYDASGTLMTGIGPLINDDDR